jgi:biotin transporter BioY
MKLFGRSGGYWLFWCSVLYLIAVFVDLCYDSNSYIWIQLAWLTVLGLPFIIKPLARWLNMRTWWEI